MQSKNIEWPVKPPDYPWTVLAAEEILYGWRDRIERVALEESTYLAALPYIRAVAVIGSSGRGSPYPLSDIDMLAIAEPWYATDPEELVREVELERNMRLARKRIPNSIEPSEWVILTRDLERAVTESDAVFLSRLKHPHWLGLVLKSVGGRVFHDSS